MYICRMKPINYILILFCFLPVVLRAQPATPAQGMLRLSGNYTSFSAGMKQVSDEVLQHNKGYEQHPELGRLYKGAPCTDCYEEIGKRTANTKSFVVAGTNGREVMTQTATGAMHYRDESGNWLTITDRLQERVPGIYEATHQPNAVEINTKEGYAEINVDGHKLRFNNGLELVYRNERGKEKVLGRANWKRYTAGDDGVYVTNVWPGIDMEVYAGRGALKTNFYVRHAMPGYAGGTLLLRDHVTADSGLVLPGVAHNVRDNISIKNGVGNAAIAISAATVWEHERVKETLEMLGYDIADGHVDIVLPGSYLNKPASAYPIVIDPLVSAVTTSTVGGSSYSPGLSVSCDYVNAANVPANVTVTDIRWSFNYIASGGAQLLNGAVDYTLGACRSPSVPGFFWFCNIASPGTCTGTNVSIFSDVSGCLPPPQCLSYPLNLNMHFYQNFAATTPCASTYITSGSPLTVTVYGHTLEASPIISAGGVTSICTGQSVTLSAAANYGATPYNYVWNPGLIHGNPVTFTPTTTTTYTVTITDACGQSVDTSLTISVVPINPIIGSTIVCVGGTTNLTNPAGPGTWASSNGAVAVVGPTTGIVTGVSAGTSIISFVTSAGCYTTTVVTVIPMPAAISGVMTLCVGNTTALTNSTPGGNWTSGSAGIATVGGTSGIVTGMAGGTAGITYTTSPGCVSTTVVTVYPNPAIAAVSKTDPTTCGASDGTMVLWGLSPGVTYDVGYMVGSTLVTISVVANSTGKIVITGLSAGVYSSITVKSPEGCTGAWHTIITLVDDGTPPVPIAASNSPVCVGAVLNLTATSAAGVTYHWSGPGGFSSTLQNPSISPVTTAQAGVYSVTASLLACVSLPGTVTVTVNDVPVISGIEGHGPITCGGTEGSIEIKGLTTGATYNIGYMQDGVAHYVSGTADALGSIWLYGMGAGTYANVFVVLSTCASMPVGPVVLSDPAEPPPPTITSNAPVCRGGVLRLRGDDAVADGTYYWEGSNGFTAAIQSPEITNAPMAAEGIYTLTYTYMNCSSTATAYIPMQPDVKLEEVKAAKYDVPYGDSVQLSASGARYYNWTPHNGTLSDYYIYNPMAYPRDSITVFTVYGMNEAGCVDSATITLRVLPDEDEYIPNAFTPNGDGLNDVFRIGNMRYKHLIDFTIYNRWGQEVYHNPYDRYGGWDGTHGGKACDLGTYFYSITLEDVFGRIRYHKGDVTLIR